ncbi:MAG: hypothetical protein HY960_15240 [Ignavibacteriae bacterium]|nr:hypothetical protein [Ignavibacteriota bacterium]
MTINTSTLLLSFEQLPELEKKEVVIEILRRTQTEELTEISDNHYVQHAENIFLELDKRETENAISETR